MTTCSMPLSSDDHENERIHCDTSCSASRHAGRDANTTIEVGYHSGCASRCAAPGRPQQRQIATSGWTILELTTFPKHEMYTRESLQIDSEGYTAVRTVRIHSNLEFFKVGQHSDASLFLVVHHSSLQVQCRWTRRQDQRMPFFHQFGISSALNSTSQRLHSSHPYSSQNRTPFTASSSGMARCHF